MTVPNYISPHSVQSISQTRRTRKQLAQHTYNLNCKLRSVVWSSRDVLDLPHSEHPIDNLAEDDMLPIEKVALGGGNEELATISVWARVRHGQ